MLDGSLASGQRGRFTDEHIARATIRVWNRIRAHDAPSELQLALNLREL
jgi:hypothetical protein